MRKIIGVTSIVALFPLAGCGDSHLPDAHLLGEQAPPEVDPEDQRLRDLQAIRVLDDSDPPQPAEWSDGKLKNAIDEQCMVPNKIGGPYCSPPAEPADACGYLECWLKTHTCRAEKYLAMAGASNETIKLTLSGHVYTVPAQSSGANARLAELARDESLEAIDKSIDFAAGRQVAIPSYTQGQSNWYKTCLLGTSPKHIDLTSLAGGAFVDSYYRGRKAIEVAVENTVAMSDAQLGSSPSGKIAGARAFAGSELSRAAAAHLLLGGNPGIAGNTKRAFCSNPPLSAQGKAALKIFREAGLAPLDVLGDAEFMDPWYTHQRSFGPTPPFEYRQVALQELLNDTTPALEDDDPEGGSVLKRLEAKWNTDIPEDTAEAAFGLALEDFREARRYLADEIRAFSRSFEAGELGPGGFKWYAATSTEMAERPAAYYSALTRTLFDYVHSNNLTTNEVEYRTFEEYALSPSGPVTNLASFVDHVYSWGSFLTKQESLQEGTKEKEILDPIRVLLTGREREGRVVYCGGPGAVIRAEGFRPEEGLIVVRGEDALACAVQGSEEGAPCTIDYDGPLGVRDVVAQLNKGGASPQGRGFDTVAYNFPDQIPTSQQRWYLLKPEDGHTEARPGPGSWRALTGFVPYSPRESAFNACIHYSIVPEAEEAVARVLAPSSQSCGEAAESCAGVRFDARMPLENELASDADPVESSWRHYLDLAKEAAVRSDELGDAYVNAGNAQIQGALDAEQRRLAQAEKAVAELEALQSVCGTAVDPVRLLDALGQSLEHASTGESCTAGGWPPPDGLCVGGTLLTDWREVIDDQELNDLADCIDAMGTKMDYMHLGDSDLCAWIEEETICGGSHSSLRCPYLPKDGYCQLPAGTAGLIKIPKENGLGLFQTTSMVPLVVEENLCDKVRRLRESPEAAAAEQIKSPNFDIVALQEYADDIKLELRYGGYVALVVNGETIAETGSPGTGPGEDWPCRTAGSPSTGRPSSCPGDSQTAQSFFCKTYNCGDQNERYVIADRIAAAVVAAKATTWSDGRPEPVLPLPHYLMNGTFPLMGMENPFVVLNHATPVTIRRVTNERWTMYTYPGAPSGNEAFRYAHSLGYTNLPIGGYKLSPGNDMEFAVADVTGVRRPNVSFFTEFWAGLSPTLPGNGYLKERLAGRMPKNPAEEAVVSFFAHYDLEGNTRTRRREKLNKLFLDKRANEEGRLYESAHFDFNYADMSLLDGLEILCRAAEGAVENQGCDPENPPELASIEDLDDMGAFINCVGDSIKHRAATTVFKQFPRGVFNRMKQTGNSAYEGNAGEMGEALSLLKTALEQTRSSRSSIGNTMNNFAEDMKILQETLASFDTQNKMADVRFNAEKVANISSCISANASAASMDFVGAIGNGVAAQVNCVNGIAQILFSDQLRDLERELRGHEAESALAETNKKFNDHVLVLEAQELALKQGYEEISRQLGVIAGLEKKAARAVNAALWHMSNQSQKQGELNNVLARQAETARIRYERAHDNAKKMAFLAKRAIEQRLGVRMADMVEDLPLVNAPASWESTVCATAGIDYGALTAEGGPTNFADTYIGEYVTKLANVVESYRLENDFHEGADTAVVSLRDDVLDVRASCEVDCRNLLAHASDFKRVSTGFDPTFPGWYAEGCRVMAATGTGGTSATGGSGGTGGQVATGGTGGEEEDVAGPQYYPGCVNAEELAERAPGLGEVRKYRVNFGYQCNEANGTCGACTDSSTCGWQPGVALGQRLELQPGRYVFSWYTSIGTWVSSSGQAAGRVEQLGGEGTVVSRPGPSSSVDGWGRMSIVFDVNNAPALVRVGFAPAQLVPPAYATQMELAAPMLERLDTTLPSNLAGIQLADMPGPGQFEDTTRSGKAVRAVCEDTSGAVFRADRWARGCLQLCPDGFASDCRDRAQTQCYWETMFHINQRGIESGQMFTQSGFARGNFNYRIEGVALNFVGTGARTCEDSNLPATCYSGAFVPYTLIHQGPYFIRNHFGDDFEAKLFTGRIEHARGLATERYFSNPIGSADKELMTDYWRQELQGRPLDGSFILRVWDEPGVNFPGIEDVQLILKYRYWTRFQ